MTHDHNINTLVLLNEIGRPRINIMMFLGCHVGLPLGQFYLTTNFTLSWPLFHLITNQEVTLKVKILKLIWTNTLSLSLYAITGPMLAQFCNRYWHNSGSQHWPGTILHIGWQLVRCCMPVLVHYEPGIGPLLASWLAIIAEIRPSTILDASFSWPSIVCNVLP